jgi:hypothetical protein
LRFAKETGFFVTAPTLATRLRDSGEHPDEGDCWSTAQVCAAAYGGDLHSQRVREVAERADAWALKNQILRGEYVNRLELEQLRAAIAGHTKSVVRSSGLTREEQDEILKSMASIKLRVRSIAAAQRRGQDGDGSSNGDRLEGQKRKRGRPRKQKEAEADSPAQPAAVPADG